MTSPNNIKILIVGAGKAGELIAGNIISKPDDPFDIVGFVDDDQAKIGKKINGIEVLGSIEELSDIVKKNSVEELFIAIPSERGEAIRRIVENTTGLRLAYKILPRSAEVLIQDFEGDYLQYIRRVKPEDLLGGEITKSEQSAISSKTKDNVFLITGAAGSIGSELSRQIVAHGAQKVIFFDWWENGMFELMNQINELHPEGNFEFIIGDVKDRKKVDSVFKIHKPTTVFHAAAYKHVPLMEHNPAEAIKNNIIGTRTVGEAAIKWKTDKFVLVSSDKAVNPTNVMGATKRAAEKIIHILSESQQDTIFCSVRFGNVINSNGSVIPIFERQIEQGGPLTVTHKEVTRYFMTIPEAVHLILQAWIMGENNDLFVLDMGEPIKIYDLAKSLITLHGYVPGEDIKINIVGLRPGEKLYEEVLVKEEEVKRTSIEKIFRTKNYLDFDRLKFLNNLNILIDAIDVTEFDQERIKQIISDMISTYKIKQ